MAWKAFMVAVPLFIYSPNSISGETYTAVSAGSTTFDQLGNEFEMLMITGRLGYRVMDFLSVEGRIATSDGGAAPTSLGTVDVTAESLYGIYTRINLPMGEEGRISPYAIAGYSAIDAQLIIDDGNSMTEYSDEFSGLSAGVGVDLFVDDRSGLFIEWVQYLDDTMWGGESTFYHTGVGYIHVF